MPPPVSQAAFAAAAACSAAVLVSARVIHDVFAARRFFGFCKPRYACVRRSVFRVHRTSKRAAPKVLLSYRRCGIEDHQLAVMAPPAPLQLLFPGAAALQAGTAGYRTWRHRSSPGHGSARQTSSTLAVSRSEPAADRHLRWLPPVPSHHACAQFRAQRTRPTYHLAPRPGLLAALVDSDHRAPAPAAARFTDWAFDRPVQQASPVVSVIATAPCAPSLGR